MIALDTPITRQISIALDLSRMAGIASFRFAGFPLGADDGVDLMLGKV